MPELHEPGTGAVRFDVCTVGVLVLVLAGVLPAQELHGIVTDAATGKPLSRAEVVLRPADGVLPRGTVTDASGRFGFFAIPPGEYHLLGSRTGYLRSTAVFSGAGRLPQPLALARGQSITGLRLPLPRAAVISGKVLHEDGEPAAGVPVTAHREFWHRLQHGYNAVARSVSDDRGEYRLFGLPPGRYAVMAAVTPFAVADLPAIEDQQVRDSAGQPVTPLREITTFLPSAPDLPGATSVELRVGSEFRNADITLAQARPGRITGRFQSGSSGQPVRGSITMYREDGSGTGLMPADVSIRQLPQNRFEILHVAPGSYQIEVEGGERGATLYYREPLRVSAGAVTEVDLVLPGPVEVAGRVQTARREDRLPEARMRVIAESVGPRSSRRSAEVNRIGQFKLSLLPGQEYRLLLQGAPAGWYLQAARLDTQDALSRGISLTSAPAAGALTLTVSPGAARLYGVTQPGARVVLQPVDGALHRWSDTEANEYGIFSFDGLTPGEYTALTWSDDQPPCDLWNPNARDDCARTGERVRLSEGSTETLSLID